MCKILFGKGRIKHSNVNRSDKKTQHARVNFTPTRICVNFTTLVHKINRKEMIFMDFDFDFKFDELDELEIMDLLDQKNYLLNILESGCSLERESEILDELDNIQEQLDILY